MLGFRGGTGGPDPLLENHKLYGFLKDGPGPPKGGGGTLIFSHIRRLGSFFGVQSFEFQYFWGFSEKLIFFGV